MTIIKYTLQELPPAILNKSLRAKQAFLSGYTSAINRGLTDDEAYFSGLSHATTVERTEKAQKQPLEPIKPKVPQHVAALLEKRSEVATALPAVTPKIKQEFLGKNALVPDSERSLVSATWDKNARLQLQFDDGQKIVTDPVPVSENIEQNITVNTNPVVAYKHFDILVEPPQYNEGMLFYDHVDHSLAYYNDEKDITVNIGREQLVRVFNNTASTLLNGKLVYVNGANSGWPTVALAKADTAFNSQSLIGMLTADIEASTYGYVCISGVVHDIDTSVYPAGTVLYLSAVTAGEYTGVIPVQPHYAVEIGTVLVQGTADGDVLVRVDRKPWYPSVEILDTSTVFTLPVVPTVFKPNTVAHNDGFSYDVLTGVVSVDTNASYTINIAFNALPSAANKHIYFYVEEFSNGGWEIKQYSGRKLKLPNQEETLVGINAARYYEKGTKIRFYIWSDASVDLITSDLQGTASGTVKTPAYRLLMAG